MKPGGCRSSTGKAIFDQEQQRWIWRRAGRRDDLHGVHLRRQDPPGHREVDRASGETVEPESRTAGPRGTVHRVPVPRSVHRFHRIDVDRRSPTPGPRHRRAGHRRFERLGPETFSVRPDERQWRTARLRGDGLQPHPSRRGARRQALGQARTATIRYQIINVPARISFSAREFSLHLPAHSRRERSFTSMLNAVNAPPKAA